MLPKEGSASEGSAAFSGDFKGVCVLRGSRWLTGKKANEAKLLKENNYQETPQVKKIMDSRDSYHFVPEINPFGFCLFTNGGISKSH